jgi:peptidyl-prolyl cis-trans isomerase D
VVVKILDKQEPTPDEIAKNLDQMREELLAQRRNEAFSVFMSGVWNEYKKHNLIRFNAKAQGQRTPGM